MSALPTVTRDTPVSALVDGNGGLGHPAARLAMNVAIDKAKKTGVGIVPVRNSAHFGACGFYALMAVEAGLIGMVTTSAAGIQVAPTNGAQARLWQPFDVEKPLAEYAPPAEVPDHEEVRGGITVPARHPRQGRVHLPDERR